MRGIKSCFVGISIIALGLTAAPSQAVPHEATTMGLAATESPAQQAPAQSQSPPTQQVGTVKAINGSTLVLTRIRVPNLPSPYKTHKNRASRSGTKGLEIRCCDSSGGFATWGPYPRAQQARA